MSQRSASMKYGPGGATKAPRPKDLGPPKLSLAKAIENKKAVKALHKQQRQVSRPSPDSSTPADIEMDATPTPSTSFATFAASASASHSSAFDDFKEADSSAPLDAVLTTRDQSQRAYMRELRKVLDLADVILMVLDARDPLGCRSAVVEREVRRREGEGKRLVFVMNKIDLVPRSNVEAWLEHLRQQYPTIAFKSSTQQQRHNLSQRKSGASASSSSIPTNTAGTSDCLGADSLMALLKNYTRSNKLKTSIVCGVVGFPNVGKSSVVNSLKRSRACGVGATPGFTKVAQEVVLDKNIKLLDSPGVVFAEEAAEMGEDEERIKRRRAEVLLRNVVKVELVEDPVSPVELILTRCQPEHLEQLYNIPPYDNVTDFLIKIALVRGRLGKGGVPDLIGSARSVLRDYSTGKIPYYTQPPRSTATALSHPPSSLPSSFFPNQSPPKTDAVPVDGASIVTGFSKAFDLAGLLGEADAEALQGAGTAFGAKEAGGMEEDAVVVEETEVDRAVGDDLTPTRKRRLSTSTSAPTQPTGPVSLPPKKRLKPTHPSTAAQLTRLLTTDEAEQLASSNPLNRAALKKARKAEAKARQRAGMLPLHGPGGEGELMRAFAGGMGMEVDEEREEREREAEERARERMKGGGGMGMFGSFVPAVPVDEDEEL